MTYRSGQATTDEHKGLLKLTDVARQVSHSVSAGTERARAEWDVSSPVTCDVLCENQHLAVCYRGYVIRTMYNCECFY